MLVLVVVVVADIDEEEEVADVSVELHDMWNASSDDDDDDRLPPLTPPNAAKLLCFVIVSFSSPLSSYTVKVMLTFSDWGGTIFDRKKKNESKQQKREHFSLLLYEKTSDVNSCVVSRDSDTSTSTFLRHPL